MGSTFFWPMDMDPLGSPSLISYFILKHIWWKCSKAVQLVPHKVAQFVPQLAMAQVVLHNTPLPLTTCSHIILLYYSQLATWASWATLYSTSITRLITTNNYCSILRIAISNYYSILRIAILFITLISVVSNCQITKFNN